MSYASAGVYIGTHSASNQYNDHERRRAAWSSMTRWPPATCCSTRTADRPGGSKYHVTMYIGGGQMIEAPRPGVNVRIVAVRYGDLVPYAGRPTG